MKDYINKQYEHHRGNSFKEEYMDYLKSMVQHLMSDMYGDSITPFRGFGELWLRHNTGLYPVLVYYALSGLI